MDKDRRDFLLNSARAGALALGSTTLWQIAPAMGQSSKGRELATMTIVELLRLLAGQKITSRQLVEQSLAAINDPQGEGSRAFLLVHEREALAAADRVDAQRRCGASMPALAGIPISIKDLFDEAGVVTLGGSIALVGTPPATRDSTVVERLKKAGAIIVGRTVRIPAALNGLVGFKPTAGRVPRDRVLPLSFTLDSIGPIAKTVADCALLDEILAAETSPSLKSAGLSSMRFAVPKTVFQDDLSPAVAKAFSSALSRLSAAGAIIVELPMVEFAQAAVVNPRGILSGVEAYSWHRQWLKERADKYDPRVLVRIRPGETVTAANYIELLRSRENFVRTIHSAASGYDAMLMPTTPDIAPTIAEVIKDDESYFRFNGRMLRNPSVVNLFDGCALSVPCHDPGSAPVGMMIAGTQNTDRKILAIGLAVEEVVWKQRH